jgi:hypothetical protein
LLFFADLDVPVEAFVQGYAGYYPFCSFCKGQPVNFMGELEEFLGCTGNNRAHVVQGMLDAPAAQEAFDVGDIVPNPGASGSNGDNGYLHQCHGFFREMGVLISQQADQTIKIIA